MQILKYNCFYLQLLLLCFGALVAYPLPIIAQENYAEQLHLQEDLPDESRLDKQAVENASKRYDYRQEAEKKEVKETVEKKERKSKKMNPATLNLIKYTLFGLIILVLGFIIFRLVAGGAILNNKKIKLNNKVYSIDDIEDNLHEVDVEAFLNEALKQNDYRLAIRLYYLAILKELSLAGHIQWKKDKTNGVYLREMRKHPKVKLFRQSTYIYEYAWFNTEDNFGKDGFETARPIFRKMLASVKNHSNSLSPA